MGRVAGERELRIRMIEKFVQRSFLDRKLAKAPEFLGLGRDRLGEYFDAEFYKLEYPDVASGRIDPLLHYMKFGWRENRAPFSGFDVDGYVATQMNGDKQTCPLAHYIRFGPAKPAPVPCDAKAQDERHNGYLRWYQSQDENWAHEMLNLLDALGMDAGRLSDLPLGRHLQAMFSPQHYRRQQGLGPEVSDNECFLRYIAFDLPEGVEPGPFFHEPTYRRKAVEHGLPPIGDESAFLHWMRHGQPLDISPSPLFSTESYLHANKDLEEFRWPKITHFLLHGIDEKRQFLPEAVIEHGIGVDTPNSTRRFIDAHGHDRGAHDELAAMRRFLGSQRMRDLVGKANDCDPDVTTNLDLPAYLPPWHERAYADFKHTLGLLPGGAYRSVVLIPFCKVGGADYVAGILARTLSEIDGPVLVLQTDQADWARPDWFDDVARVDLSGAMAALDQDGRTRTLYEFLRRLRPAHVFNVNSQLTFQTIQRFGRQLSTFAQLHAYYFCADRTPSGDEAGHPVSNFAPVFEHLTTAITDSVELAETLGARFMLPPDLARRLRPIYTPARTEPSAVPVVEAQVRGAENRKRPVLIWAGRFDRQKRFDLLLDVARSLQEVDFLCWGKAVLDPAPDLSDLPGNVTLHDPFTSYGDLPLEEVDGFLYTSDWDGIPTVLIELGAMGMPIVASTAGGVPELIDETTGWPVPVGSTAEDYATAVKDMLAAPQDRIARAVALRHRVTERHSGQSYASALSEILQEAS